MNDKQSVKLRKGLIELKKYFEQQIGVSFKLYAHSESIVKWIKRSNRNNNTWYTGKYQGHIPYNFVYKVVCIDGQFSKKTVLIRGKDTVYKFIEVILEE